MFQKEITVFHTIEEFQRAWNANCELTAKVFGNLTDKSLSQAVADNHRTIARLSWHIVTTIPDMMDRLGLRSSRIKPDSLPPGSASEIMESYDFVSRDLLRQIKQEWNDSTLEIIDDLFGERWARGASLRMIIDHEIHHRGQLTVLMRQAGLHVPGIFGPSLEEWSQYGMQPPEV